MTDVTVNIHKCWSGTQTRNCGTDLCPHNMPVIKPYQSVRVTGNIIISVYCAKHIWSVSVTCVYRIAKLMSGKFFCESEVERIRAHLQQAQDMADVAQQKGQVKPLLSISHSGKTFTFHFPFR